MADHNFQNLFRTRHDLIQEADQAVAQAERAFGRAEGDNGTRWAAVPTYWEDNRVATPDPTQEKKRHDGGA